MKSDMKNLIISFIFFAGFFLFVGIIIGNSLKIENDFYFFPLAMLSLIGFTYSSYNVVKSQ